MICAKCSKCKHFQSQENSEEIYGFKGGACLLWMDPTSENDSCPNFDERGVSNEN